MAPRDVRPLAQGEGSRSSYWVKEHGAVPGAVGCLRLVVIDEYGEVKWTPMRASWDNAAMTIPEATQVHLAGLVSEADRDLERRRREAPKPEEKPVPMDPATERFLADD